MPTRSIHAPEPSPGIEFLQVAVLAAVGIMAALLGDPRVMGETPLAPQHMVVFALALFGLWLVVDLVEKQRFRRSRPKDLANASTIVHRTGDVSRAVFPLAVGGIVAVLWALPLGGLCQRLVPGSQAGSLAAIVVTAGLAIGAAKLVTIARYGLRSRILQLTPEALNLDAHRQRTIPWQEIQDARLVLVRRRRHSVPYLALALTEPGRHGLRPVSLWQRWTASGALEGDALLTNLDIFLDRPEEIVEDVRRFIRRHHDPGHR
jgi:hypothetical protein